MSTTGAAQADVGSDAVDCPVINATRMPLLKSDTVPHFKLDLFFTWLAFCVAHYSPCIPRASLI